MTYILSLVVAIIMMIIITYSVKKVKKNTYINKSLITLLVIINLVITIHVFRKYHLSDEIYIRQNWLLLSNYTLYLIFLKSKLKSNQNLFMNVNFKKVRNLMIIYFILSFINIISLDMGRLEYVFGYDLIFLEIVIIIKYYGYIYIYSVADKISEDVPEFISQFETIYIRSKEMEKKPAIVWLYYIIYTFVMYINKYPTLSTLIAITILGPYLLISIESIRIANGIRKILKAKGFYNYNIFLGINLFIQVVLICFLLLGVEYRWTELLRIF